MNRSKYIFSFIFKGETYILNVYSDSIDYALEVVAKEHPRLYIKSFSIELNPYNRDESNNITETKV